MHCHTTQGKLCLWVFAHGRPQLGPDTGHRMRTWKLPRPDQVLCEARRDPLHNGPTRGGWEGGTRTPVCLNPSPYHMRPAGPRKKLDGSAGSTFLTFQIRSTAQRSGSHDTFSPDPTSFRREGVTAVVLGLPPRLYPPHHLHPSRSQSSHSQGYSPTQAADFRRFCGREPVRADAYNRNKQPKEPDQHRSLVRGTRGIRRSQGRKEWETEAVEVEMEEQWRYGQGWSGRGVGVG